MVSLSSTTLAEIDPNNPFGYTPPDVSGGNWTAPPPPAPAATFDPSQSPVPYAPDVYAAPPPPEPAYTPAPPQYTYQPDMASLDQQFTQQATAQPYADFGPAPAPVSGAYLPPAYTSAAQQYVLGAGAQSPAELSYITDIAQQNNYRPTYADIGAAQGQYGQQYSDAVQTQQFAGEQGQQTQASLAGMDPMLRKQLGYVQVQDPTAPNFGQWVYHESRDFSQPVDYSLLGTLKGAVSPAWTLANDFGNLQATGKLFGVDVPDIPGVPGWINNTIYTALSPASVASFGLGAETMGAGAAIKQAATRGIPAIAGSTLGSEYAAKGAEALGAPDWAQQAAGLAGGLVGGVAGWQAPELLAPGVNAAKAAGRALAESPNVQAALQGAKAGVLAPGTLATSAIHIDDPHVGSYIDALDRHGIEFGYDEHGFLQVADPEAVARTADELNSRAASEIFGDITPNSAQAVRGHGPGERLFGERDDRTYEQRTSRGRSKGNSWRWPGRADAATYQGLDDAERLAEILDPTSIPDTAITEGARTPWPADAGLPGFTPLTPAERQVLAAPRGAALRTKAGQAGAIELGVNDANAFVDKIMREPGMTPRTTSTRIGAEIDRRGYEIGRVNLSTNEKAFRRQLEEIATAMDANGSDFLHTWNRDAAIPSVAQSVAATAPAGVVPSAAEAGLPGVPARTQTLPTGTRPEAAVTQGLGRSGGSPPGGRTIAGLSDEGASALQKVNDALREEIRIRRSGTAAAEISAGRAQQAAGIREGFNDALGMGKSFEETQAAIRAGAKSETGTLRQTFAKAIDLTEAEKSALLNDLGKQATASGKAFDLIRGGEALSKLVGGEGLQPAEIKLLRSYFGDEVAKLAAEATVDRPSIVAQLDDAAKARIKQRGLQEEARYRKTGEAIARQEEIAKAQATLAQQIQEQAHLNPTNKRLQQFADAARERGLKAATEADRMEADLAQRAWDDLAAKRTKDIAKGAATEATAASKAAEAADKLNPNQRQVIDEVKRVMAEVPPRTPKGTVGGVEPLNREAVNALENWMQAQNTLTTAVSDSTGRISSFVNRTIQGNTADSFTSAVLVQRNILENALIHTGMDEAIARKVANLMTEWSVRQRLPDTTPASIVKRERTRIINAERAKGATLEAARAKADAEVAARFNTSERAQRVLEALREADQPAGSVASAASTLSSELKNTMFGIGDVAVLGQQGLKAGSVAWPNIVAGLVNRILSAAQLPSVDVTTNGVAVGRRTQEILDGVRHNIATGIVNPDEGTLLRHLPFGAGAVDRPLKAAIQWMTDLQFNKVLGNIRSLNYEGNLVLLKALGQDVTDPLVRQAAARSANVHTSAGELALRASRRTAEQASLLSPSMLRARIQELGQLARALGPGATASERILAASAVFSIATSVLAVGKLLNDTVGLGDFEFDPSKPGFGKITIPTPGGGTRVVSIFPQVQLAQLLTRSSRALAEGDTETLAKQLGSFSLASMSPVAGIVAKNFGYGFDPDQGGWAYGDYGSGSDWKSRVLNSLPIPPIGQSLIQGDTTPLGLALNAAGVNNYPESAYAEAGRRAGVESFFSLPKDQRDAFLAKPENVDIAKRLADEEAKKVAAGQDILQGNPDVKSAAFDAAANTRTDINRQYAADLELAAARFRMGGESQGDGAKLREDIADAGMKRNIARLQTDADFQGLFNLYKTSGTLPDDPLKAADVQWFSVDDKFRDPITGKITDYTAYQDAQERMLASFTPEQRKHVLDYQSSAQGVPPEVQQYYDDQRKIEASGYWDRQAAKFTDIATGTPSISTADWRRAHPEVDALLRTYGYGADTTKLMNLEDKLAAEQRQSDALLEKNPAGYVATWKDQMHQRMDELRGAKDLLYADLPPSTKSALDTYYNAVDTQFTGKDGAVDWDAAQAWLAKQPKDVQDAVANVEKRYLSPEVAKYKAAVKTITDSGYWDIQDRVTKVWATQNGMQWPEGQSADKFWGAMSNEVYQRVVAKGITGAAAVALTNQVMDTVMKPVLDLSGKVAKVVRESDPALLRLLIEWGFYDPGKELTGTLVGATLAASR